MYCSTILHATPKKVFFAQIRCGNIARKRLPRGSAVPGQWRSFLTKSVVKTEINEERSGNELSFSVRVHTVFH